MNKHQMFVALLVSGFVAFLPAMAETAAVGSGPMASESTAAGAADPARQLPHTMQALKEARAGKYGKLKRRDEARLTSAEREIKALQARHPDLSTLDTADKVALFNAQEAILSVVTGLRRSELVCTYHERAGTRFKTKHCTTRDMADAARRAARESTATAQRDLCVPGETSTC